MVQDDLEGRLGYQFKNRGLLIQAMTHPSAVKEGRVDGPDNQRLEYLGDAVLHLVTANLLVTRFPASDEGDLTLLRASMVNRESLADIAIRVGIEESVIAGPSLLKAEPVARRTAAGNALEALVGAVYRDGGYEAARVFAERLLGEPPASDRRRKGAKAILQELLQARFDGVVPHYSVVETPEGGERRFTATVFFGERSLGRGSGRTKKQAEEAAAQEAVKGLGAG